MNYILSRRKTDDEINYVLNKIETKNNILLIQLLISYDTYQNKGKRNFKFTKYNLLKKHTETEEEVESRKSMLSKDLILKLKRKIKL